MGSQKNNLLQKLVILGLVSTVGIAAGISVSAQTTFRSTTATYAAELEEAQALAEMIAANPDSPAAQAAILRLKVLIAQLPAPVRAQAVRQLAATVSLPPAVVASIVRSMPNLPVAARSPSRAGYF